MASTPSRTMDTLGGPGSRPLKRGLGWPPVALAALAIAGLLAWSGAEGESGRNRPETRTIDQGAAAEAEAAFDGRGKWSGYAR